VGVEKWNRIDHQKRILLIFCARHKPLFVFYVKNKMLITQSACSVSTSAIASMILAMSDVCEFAPLYDSFFV
jgi:hypothetical protein